MSATKPSAFPSSSPSALPTDTLYTLCPVLVASNIAVELGWLDEEFRKVNARATYLRSLPSSGSWSAHFNHRSDRLIRDGGNSPAVWARADVADTVLVGLTQAQPSGKIVVRADSGLYRVADLKGKKIALYKTLDPDTFDHRRATSEHGILAALALHGLSRDDVELVDIVDEDLREGAPASRPSELRARWDRRRLSLEAQAVKDGRVDALYDYSVGVAEALDATGEFKTIEDLDRHPDWTLRIANAPRTITVSRELADAHPEVVVAFLRAAIRAGRWTNAHPAAATELFRRVTVYPTARAIHDRLVQHDLVPNLSAQNLAGLQIESDFLHRHGYIRNRVDVKAWADDRFLQEALATL